MRSKQVRASASRSIVNYGLTCGFSASVFDDWLYRKRTGPAGAGSLSGCRAELPAVGRSKRSGWKACWGKLGRRAWDEKISAGLIRESGLPAKSQVVRVRQIPGNSREAFRSGCVLHAMNAQSDRSVFLVRRHGGRAEPQAAMVARCPTRTSRRMPCVRSGLARRRNVIVYCLTRRPPRFAEGACEGTGSRSNLLPNHSTRSKGISWDSQQSIKYSSLKPISSIVMQ
jgi:hypothetical protein